MNGPQNKTVLAFMAHPDDAEMLCGGTLCLLAGRGWQVHIATAAAGDCGSVTLPGPKIAAVRRQEASISAGVIGGTYHSLDLPDTRVSYTTDTIARAVDLFRRVSPSLVLTHPRYDYMMDHEQTHLLARAAAFAYAIPNASAETLNERAAVPHLYYCDPMEGNDPYTGKPVVPTTLVDISTIMDIKTRMLASHASQRDWLRAHHGMDEYIDSMKRHASRRGEMISAMYAEAFVRHRGHGFPVDDILATLA